MNEKEFLKKYVQPKTVVHCHTEELAKELLTKAHEYGLKWSSSDSYLYENYWDDEMENTCYDLFEGLYYNKESYQENGYTIIEFNGFEKEETNGN